MNNIIIGKRTTVGAAITSLAGVFAHFFPEDAAAIIGLAVPLTFITQIVIAKVWGVTTK